MVFLHGGGWTVGTAAAYGGLAARLAAGLSAVVLAVEFRRAPEHPFPAAVQDAVAASGGRWTTRRPGAGGRRRGQRGRQPGRGRVPGAARRGGGSPPPSCCSTRRSGPVRSGRRCPRTAGHPFLGLADMGWYTRQYVPEGVELTDPRISPLEDDDGHAGLPPALVATAELDALRDSGRPTRPRWPRRGCR